MQIARLPLNVLLAASLAACSDSTGTPGAPGPWTVSVIDGANQADTIGAELIQPLDVIIRAANQAPVRDVPLTFSNVFSGVPAQVATADGPFAASRVVRTDSDGRVSLRVRFGNRAGAAGISISDSTGTPGALADFTIQPGNATSIDVVATPDALFLGHTISLVATVKDREGNARSDVAPLAAAPDILNLATQGSATGTGIGVTTVTATLGGMSESVVVTVVPNPTIAAGMTALGDPESGITRVYTMKADGTSRQLVMSSGFFTEPYVAWSRDGARLVFNRGDHWPRLNVWSASGIQGFLSDSSLVAEGQPRFSADGLWVYFTGIPGSQNAELWRAQPDGSNAERVGPAAGFDDVDSDPDPSPDGTTLVYATNRSDFSRPSLRFLDVATGQTSNPGIFGLSPRWSPDGAHIAYIPAGPAWGYIYTTRNYYCACDRLVIANADGSDPREVLAPKDSISAVFDWIDGNHILGRFNGGIGVVNVTTGRIVRAPNTLGFLSPTPMP